MAKPDADINLPESDFTYLAGNSDRPFSHFTGRWQGIKPVLDSMLGACASDRPLRVVDLGSCSGFFALKTAYRHPEADIVAVEGSVGIGNGTVGVQGTVRQILQTDAVQTHLRWIHQLGLTNCFVAPEVWDYRRVCDLAASGRPICDAMFMLSVVHHIDNVSAEQYARAGFSRVEGGIDLLAKLLLLSPRHFVELPNPPWMKELYEKYGSARDILEAAAKATGLQWAFKGPVHSAEWFGQRDVWVIECQDAMPELDIQSCPFPLLYRGDEEELISLDAASLGDDVTGPLGDFPPVAGLVAKATSQLSNPLGGLPDLGELPLDLKLHGAAEPLPLDDVKGFGGLLADENLGFATACQSIEGTLLDPALLALSQPHLGPVSDKVGRALKAATPALLLAHLSLREAMTEAEDLLANVRKLGFQ
eukprot:gb/GFBE01076369.1/.p1 GENE.gb/GFBE01076369.1/~~gb/GFBE01076369.1/.p1  ORF type:complete len:420 (+),score=89.63 gb/GFBE01076369.1/:1-1260(+)